jgi:hypothetical protein
MTRKDYNKIAESLKNSKPCPDLKDMLFAWEVTVAGLADALHDDNPRFDYDRFIKACGFDTFNTENV